jgi:hypothetical protein
MAETADAEELYVDREAPGVGAPAGDGFDSAVVCMRA